MSQTSLQALSPDLRNDSRAFISTNTKTYEPRRKRKRRIEQSSPPPVSPHAQLKALDGGQEQREEEEEEPRDKRKRRRMNKMSNLHAIAKVPLPRRFVRELELLVKPQPQQGPQGTQYLTPTSPRRHRAHENATFPATTPRKKEERMANALLPFDTFGASTKKKLQKKSAGGKLRTLKPPRFNLVRQPAQEEIGGKQDSSKCERVHEVANRRKKPLDLRVVPLQQDLIGSATPTTARAVPLTMTTSKGSDRKKTVLDVMGEVEVMRAGFKSAHAPLSTRKNATKLASMETDLTTDIFSKTNSSSSKAQSVFSFELIPPIGDFQLPADVLSQIPPSCDRAVSIIATLSPPCPGSVIQGPQQEESISRWDSLSLSPPSPSDTAALSCRKKMRSLILVPQSQTRGIFRPLPASVRKRQIARRKVELEFRSTSGLPFFGQTHVEHDAGTMDIMDVVECEQAAALEFSSNCMPDGENRRNIIPLKGNEGVRDELVDEKVTAGHRLIREKHVDSTVVCASLPHHCSPNLGTPSPPLQGQVLLVPGTRSSDLFDSMLHRDEDISYSPVLPTPQRDRLTQEDSIDSPLYSPISKNLFPPIQSGLPRRQTTLSTLPNLSRRPTERSTAMAYSPTIPTTSRQTSAVYSPTLPAFTLPPSRNKERQRCSRAAPSPSVGNLGSFVYPSPIQPPPKKRTVSFAPLPGPFRQKRTKTDRQFDRSSHGKEGILKRSHTFTDDIPYNRQKRCDNPSPRDPSSQIYPHQSQRWRPISDFPSPTEIAQRVRGSALAYSKRGGGVATHKEKQLGR
ncbi:hypothetical protein BT69DRAFT_1278544 [Atractiella rhizophila]|nr:hypothetical protein BT69DRAFT_1278544 [Atractiella rhizophila]